MNSKIPIREDMNRDDLGMGLVVKELYKGLRNLIFDSIEAVEDNYVKYKKKYQNPSGIISLTNYPYLYTA